MVIQCKNLISLYILHDQRRANLPFYPIKIEALKTNIHQEIWRIPLEMRDTVIANFNVRVPAVIHRSEWIEHVINLKIMSKTVLLKILSRFTRRRSGKYDFFQGSQVRYFHFDQNRLWGATSLWGSTRGLFVLLYDEIKIMKTH